MGESPASGVCRARRSPESIGEECALCPVSCTLNGKCKFVSIIVLSRFRPPLLNLETGQGRPPDAESDGLPKKAEIDNRGGPVVSNYRFIRDMTKGVEDQWTINVVNHFLLQEVGRGEE